MRSCSEVRKGVRLSRGRLHGRVGKAAPRGSHGSDQRRLEVACFHIYSSRKGLTAPGHQVWLGVLGQQLVEPTTAPVFAVLCSYLEQNSGWRYFFPWVHLKEPIKDSQAIKLHKSEKTCRQDHVAEKKVICLLLGLTSHSL